MKGRSIVASLIAPLLLLHGGVAAAQQSGEECPTDLRERLQQAESDGNLEALAEIYAGDIVYQNPETAPVVGSDAVLLLWRFLLDRATLKASYSSADCRVTDGGVEDQGTFVQSYAMRDGSREASDTLHYSLRFQTDSTGTWRVVSAVYGDDAQVDLRVPYALRPTGARRIGVLSLQAVDSSRAELLTEDPADFREVSAQVWYPAIPGVDARPEKYRTREMVRATASFLGWPIFFNSFFELVDSHSFPGAAGDRTGAPYPVALYHHGYGGFTRVHVALIEDLVSHGFVVASVGHAFESAFLERPDGSLVPFEPENPAYVGRLEEAHGAEQEEMKDRVVEARNIDEQQVAYRALLAASPRHQESTRTWAADGSFVLDHLAELSVTEGPLEGLLDLTRVGAIGHSLGGAAAGHAIAVDPRVIAGVDLDGFMFGDLIDNQTEAALMLVSAARPQAVVGGSALTLFFEGASGPAYLLVIEGFEHGTFTDLPLFLGAWPGEGSAADGERALVIQRAYVRAFFDRHLRDVDGGLLDGPSADFPEVSVRARNAP